jgi:hypothetical protein
MAGRLGVVVLDKGHVQTRGLGENAGIETFEEKPTVIAKNLWFKQKDIGNGGRSHLH